MPQRLVVAVYQPIPQIPGGLSRVIRREADAQKERLDPLLVTANVVDRVVSLVIPGAARLDLARLLLAGVIVP
jgi:hypothetical protein